MFGRKQEARETTPTTGHTAQPVTVLTVVGDTAKMEGKFQIGGSIQIECEWAASCGWAVSWSSARRVSSTLRWGGGRPHFRVLRRQHDRHWQRGDCSNRPCQRQHQDRFAGGRQGRLLYG